VNILPASTYNGSTTTLVGEKYKGDGYHGRTDGLHTVAWGLTGFTGSIGMQGSLVADPTDSDWFDINLDVNEYYGVGARILPVTVSSLAYVAATEKATYNFKGNFVWVRVAISNWSAGTVNAVFMNR